MATYHNHTKKMIDLLKDYKPEFDKATLEKRLKMKLGCRKMQQPSQISV